MYGGVNLCGAGAQHLLFARALTQLGAAKAAVGLITSEMRLGEAA